MNTDFDFTPPAGASFSATRGLAIRLANGRGGNAASVAIARDLSSGGAMSPQSVRRMKSHFDRHAEERRSVGFTAGEEGFPSDAKISDLLWGGRAGEAWATDVVCQMDARTYAASSDGDRIDDEELISQRSFAMQNVERRYLGSFDAVETADRSLLTVETREDPETGKTGTYTVGYAAKFGTNSLLLGDFVERLAPTAFDIVKIGKDSTGKPLSTRCLFNHDPNHLLGRYPTTMKMTVDKIGLRYSCLLPESRADIAEMISRGDLRGSSFSFVVAEGGERWSTEDGQSIRTVTKIKALLDCSPVTYPAYDSATVSIAKRSYEVFQSTTRSRSSSEIEKTRQFIADRRDCGRDADGKFGSGNSCAGASESSDSSWREGGKVGALLGAAAGVIGGGAGMAAGAAIGAVAGATAGLFGTQSQKPLEDAYKATGTSLAKVDKAAKILDKPMVVSAGEGGSLVMKGGGVTVEVHPGEKETGVPKYMVMKGVGSAIGGTGTESAGRLADSVTKAAKQLGVEMVIVHVDGATDGAHVGAFQDAGYSHSLSNDATEVTLTKSFPKSKSRRSYDDLMKFYEARGFCKTGQGNGIDNSCGSKSLDSGDKPKSLEQVRLEAAGTWDESQKDMKMQKAFDRHDELQPLKDKLREKGISWSVFAGKAASHGKTSGLSRDDSYRQAVDELEKGDDTFASHLDKIGMSQKTRRSYDDLMKFYEARGFCATGKDGGVDNSCGGSVNVGEQSSDKYMEWSKGKDKEAQGFIDKARTDHTLTAEKNGGKSDEGGGVQTWSKGDHFPWTIKQVGTDDGHVQGQHPDGSKTEKYPFTGGNAAGAMKKAASEIARHAGKRADQVVADTLKFLKDRRV